MAVLHASRGCHVACKFCFGSAILGKGYRTRDVDVVIEKLRQVSRLAGGDAHRPRAAGMLEMKLAGATNLAQDESSCVVFGMPGEAIERGAVDQVAPLSQLPRLALQRVFRMPD